MPQSPQERLRELAERNPDEFTRLMRKLNEHVVRPHSGQQLVLDSPARFKVMNCGRRWGKTVLAAKIIVSKSYDPNRMLWWVAPTYKVVKRGYAEVLKQIPKGVLDHAPPPETNFDAGRSVILRFKNGTRMEFYSAERPEGMLGAAVDYAVLDEAAIMKSSIWNQIVSPTLIDHLGGALMISTPRGRNWFYKVWQKGQQKDQEEWESWTFTTQDNPTLPPGEATRMASDMPKMEADQEIYAKWIASGSSVFNVPDRMIEYDTILEDGTLEAERPQGHVVFGIDLARTNDYTVIYGANANTRRNCYFERFQDVSWYDQKRRIVNAIRKVMKAGATGVTLMMDSTGVGDPIVEDMEMMGFDVVPINFTTHKTNMVRLLSKDIEEGHCSLLDEGLEEFYSYQMTVSPAGRYTYSAPSGEHDDVVSAKMLQWYGIINYGPPDVRSITASTSEADPYEDTEDAEPWSDLVDPDDPTDDPAHAEFEVGLGGRHRQPTQQELLARGWF